LCKAEVKVKDSQRDHVDPVVPVDGSHDPAKPNWDVIIERMMPFVEGWQVLCKPCHKEKTKAENAERDKNRGKNE